MSSSNSSFVQDNYGIGNAGSAGSNRATRRLIIAEVSNSASESWFEQHEGPTLLVATAIYASWLFLLASHRYVPWWITVPLAGYVVQWHFSLQHQGRCAASGGYRNAFGARSSGRRSGSGSPFRSCIADHIRSTIAIVISPIRGRIQRNRPIKWRKTGRITAGCRDGCSSSTDRSWAACLLDPSCAHRTFLSRKLVE